MTELKQYSPLSTAILVFILILLLLYSYSPLVLESNFFVALITFFVGSFVIYLYIKQKIDYKRDAASIILMEIRNAEKTIDSIKAGQVITSNIVLLPTNNWTRNNYLFIDNLDRDDLDLVNNFYNQCALIDKSLAQLNIASQLEQKSNHIHKKLVEIAHDLTRAYSVDIKGTDLNNIKTAFDIQKNNFLKIIESEGHVFSPGSPISEIQNALSKIEKITTSTAGDKLKKIASLK